MEEDQSSGISAARGESEIGFYSFLLETAERQSGTPEPEDNNKLKLNILRKRDVLPFPQFEIGGITAW